MSDPLFSENNAVQLPPGARGSSYYGNSIPGGRMKWYLLKEGKCARCGYLLVSEHGEQNGGVVECENPHCSFKITPRRLKTIIDDMLDTPRDEDTNMGLLNNL